MEEKFLKASKLKLRFSTNRGQLSTEDLWELSLESLDTIAKAVNRQIKDESEESFINKKTKANTENELRLEILKAVIEIKLAEKEAKAARSERNAKLAQFRELLASKQNEELQGKSKEDIEKMIKELEEQE